MQDSEVRRDGRRGEGTHVNVDPRRATIEVC
jgi:hypothetical protein